MLLKRRREKTGAEKEMPSTKKPNMRPRHAREKNPSHPKSLRKKRPKSHPENRHHAFSLFSEGQGDF